MTPTSHPEDIVDAFWSKVEKTATCWLWNGSTTGRQAAMYGRFSVAGRGVGAHRFAYELVKGPIPVGLTLDHLCRQTRCVNPEHLEPVTNKENTLRGIGPTAQNAVKVRCVKGHEFTAENTDTSHHGWRRCRECQRAHHRKWKAQALLSETDRP